MPQRERMHAYLKASCQPYRWLSLQFLIAQQEGRSQQSVCVEKLQFVRLRLAKHPETHRQLARDASRHQAQNQKRDDNFE